MSKQVLRLEIDSEADTMSIELQAGPIVGSMAITQISKTLTGLTFDPAATLGLFQDIAAASQGHRPGSRMRPPYGADRGPAHG